MARYSKQIEATKAAHMASRALADAATVHLERIWTEFEEGKLTLQEYETEVKSIVRFSYREAAVVARSLTIQQSEMTDWDPQGSLARSAYLTSLLSDVSRNFVEYREGPQDEKAIRRLKLRVGLTAITAAERGFTDSQLKHYGELRELGYSIKKLWLANFLNNEPCVDCIRLNGVEVPFDQEFPIPTLSNISVYRDLQGPPLHVRCKCVMVVLISSVDNLFDRVPTARLTIPTTMTTDTVKSLPVRIFNSIVKVLRSITRKVFDG